MLLKLLLTYATGVKSSREMERQCHSDVALRWLRANSAQAGRSIFRWRRRHLPALDDLFIKLLTLCAESGLVRRCRVAPTNRLADAESAVVVTVTQLARSDPRSLSGFVAVADTEKIPGQFASTAQGFIFAICPQSNRQVMALQTCPGSVRAVSGE